MKRQEMKKCKYCGEPIDDNLEFCRDECKNNYMRMLEKDSSKIKYFILGIVIGFFVMFWGIISGSSLKTGFGIVLMGITVTLLPFTTPETTAILGYERAKLVGRLLGVLLIIVGVWTGCQQMESKINHTPLNCVTDHCGDIALRENKPNEEQPNEDQDVDTLKEDIDVSDIELLKKIHKIKIEEQSFEFKLGDWGEVTFVSCMPHFDDNTDPLTDVSFYLIKDEKFLYHFPDVEENNIRPSGFCEGVSFVLFEDIDEDNWEDVIIGVSYISGAGPQGMIPYTEIRIYEEDYGRKFVYNKHLCDELNKRLPQEADAEYVKDMILEFKQEEADTIGVEYKEKPAEPKIDPDLGEVVFERPEFVLYRDTTEDSPYTCRIYNGDGILVKQKTLSSLMMPYLELVTDDIVLILTNAGTNLGFYTYYDRKNDIETETFLNVEAQEGCLIAYMEKVAEEEEVCLIIRDMFDKEVYYREIKRNFTPHISIDMMINSVVFLGEGVIQIEYRDKDSQELVREMIDL